MPLKEKGQISEAENNYRKTIALDPEHINSYHNLALISQERGQIEEGLNLAKKVLKLKKVIQK